MSGGLSGAELGEHRALAGWGCRRGSSGVCRPLPSAGQTEAPQGRGIQGHHQWMSETVHQKNFWGLCGTDGHCLPGLRFMRVGGSRAQKAQCRGGLGIWGTGDSHSSQHCRTGFAHSSPMCPWGRWLHQGPGICLRKAVGDTGLPSTEGPVRPCCLGPGISAQEPVTHGWRPRLQARGLCPKGGQGLCHPTQTGMDACP